MALNVLYIFYTIGGSTWRVVISNRYTMCYDNNVSHPRSQLVVVSVKSADCHDNYDKMCYQMSMSELIKTCYFVINKLIDSKCVAPLCFHQL